MPVIAHTEQGVLVNESAGLVFWPILKAGHTTFDDWMQYVGFRHSFREGFEDADGMTHVAVVRDPFVRYVSAVYSMWDCGHVADVGWEHYIDGVEAWNQRTGRPWTRNNDMHFAPQHDRVGKMPDPVLFALEDLEPFRAWLESHGLDSGGRPFFAKNVNDPARRRYALDTIGEDIVRSHYAEDVHYESETLGGL